jgi:hypothetical protein
VCGGTPLGRIEDNGVCRIVTVYCDNCYEPGNPIAWGDTFAEAFENWRDECESYEA